MNNIILPICLVFSISLYGQDTNNISQFTNVLIRFRPDNQPYIGITNYPTSTENVLFQTNVTGWNTNMTVDQFEAHVLAIQSSEAWRVGKSNANYIASSRTAANLARLVQLYDLIPQGRSGCSNSAEIFSTIEASLASGTNTQAQVVNRIRQLNQEANSLNTRQSYILEYLQRLGPELKALYKPDQDTAQ